MEWLFLLLAILLEIAGTTMLKLSDGFTKWLPSVAVVVFYALSFGALSFTLKRIDVGVAYAVWSALGTALIATIGVLWFHEDMPPGRWIGFALVCPPGGGKPAIRLRERREELPFWPVGQHQRRILPTPGVEFRSIRSPYE